MRASYVATAIAAVVTLTPQWMLGSEVYVAQGSAFGPVINACEMYRWTGDVVFHNANSTPATVTLLDLSNGTFDPLTSRMITIPAGKTVSINSAGRFWRPVETTTSGPLWIDHLDIPDGVIVESRIELGVTSTCGGLPGPRKGKQSFPIFRQLQPANLPRFHVGTDLGLVDARNNVAVYNAGNQTAHVHIELRAGCDDSLLATQDVTLSANNIQQFGFPSTTTAGCPSGSFQGGTNLWVTYMVVTVDQPSLSFVSSLANRADLLLPYAVSSSVP